MWGVEQLMKVLILHPGKMGTSLGTLLQGKGHDVIVSTTERSNTTKNNAEQAGFINIADIDEAIRQADVVISISMGAGIFPHAAAAVKNSYKGIFIDANHVGSESKEIELKALLEGAGIRYVEAAIYGWPYPHPNDPHNDRTIYVSGEDEEALVIVEGMFAETPFAVERSVLSAKAIKRGLEEATHSENQSVIDHGFGVVEFSNLFQVDDQFLDEYLARRAVSEPSDYIETEDGMFVNRGGYLFTKEDISGVPIRYLRLVAPDITDQDKEFHSSIQSAMLSCIKTYLGLYPEASDCVTWRSDAHLAVYGPGAGMGIHHDTAIGHAGGNENAAFNVVSASLILSDRCDGGGLGLKRIGKIFKPQKGTAILYPSGYVGSHFVETVTSGRRVSYLEFFGHGTRSGEVINI